MTTVTISIQDYERFKWQELILKWIKEIDNEQQKKREKQNEYDKIIDSRYKELKDMEDKIIKNETVIIISKDVDREVRYFWLSYYHPIYKYTLPNSMENSIIEDRKNELIKIAEHKAQQEIDKIKKLSFWERVFYKE